MAKRKAPSGKELKQIRHNLAELKRKGLWSGDARKAKGGWRQKQTLKNFSEVLAGKAAVVNVGRKQARNMGEDFRAKNGRVVIPVRKGERPRFNKRSGAITSNVSLYDKEYRRLIFTKKFKTVDDLPSPPKGKKYYYGLISKGGGGMRFDDKAELLAFLAQYDSGKKNLVEKIEVLQPIAGEDYDDE